MTFLTAYLDDSGKDDTPAIFVGGAIAKNSSWLAIESGWKAILRMYKVGAFHAADFNNKLGEFSGWTEERKKELSIRLIGLIVKERCALIGHGCLIRDFEVVKSEFPNVDVTPYQLCVDICICRLMDWVEKRKHTQPIQINIEAGNKHTSFLYCKWQEQLKHDEMQKKYKVAGIQVLPKSDYVHFQVADLVAYEHFKLLKQYMLTDNNRIRPSTEALESRILPESGFSMDAEQIRQAFRSIVKLMNRDFS